MIPRILNLQARPPEATEPCTPDVRYFPVGDNVVAFDANTLVAVEISKAQYEALTAPREAPATSFTEERAAHRLLFSGVRPKFDLSPDITCRQLTLHLSNQCNQRCKYCWIAKDDVKPRVPSAHTDGHSQAIHDESVQCVSVRGEAARGSTSLPVMTREIAAAALTMFSSDGRDLRIGFFGGEPLLHFGLLAIITEMAERHAEREKCRAFFHVTTNATLITPMVARFLAEHGFSIIVSCDGPEKLHDVARGAGSHAAMIRGLERLHRADCSGRIVLRGTWSTSAPGTAHDGAPAEILQRLGALNELCSSGLAAGVALEPVAGADYGHTLDAEIRSACNWFAARARSGGTPRWQYLEKTLQRVLWQQFRPSECGAGRGYYTVGPTGQLYACHKQQNSEIGSVVSTPSTPSTVVHIDESLRQKWLDNRFCSRRECSLCWARHVCGGACRSESLEFCGGITEPHAGRCMLMRHLVAEALVLAATLPRETLLRICPALTVPPPFAPAGRTVSHA
jgi:uncharacterized protein